MSLRFISSRSRQNPGRNAYNYNREGEKNDGHFETRLPQQNNCPLFGNNTPLGSNGPNCFQQPHRRKTITENKVFYGVFREQSFDRNPGCAGLCKKGKFAAVERISGIQSRSQIERHI